MVYVVDTHAMVWYPEASKKLGSRARKVMDSGTGLVVIPAMVLAEIAFLYGRRRIGTRLDDVLEHVARAENFTVHPVDQTVVAHLPASLNIHDGLIVATALLYAKETHQETAVVTCDAEIVESGIVRTLW